VGGGAPSVSAPTLQLLSWLDERPRTYGETIETWKTSCPRLTVWENAVTDGLVRVERGQVLLTAAGAELLADSPRCGAGAPGRLCSTGTSSSPRIQSGLPVPEGQAEPLCAWNTRSGSRFPARSCGTG
jgi:hypothetical protein